MTAPPLSSPGPAQGLPSPITPTTPTAAALAAGVGRERRALIGFVSLIGGDSEPNPVGLIHQFDAPFRHQLGVSIPECVCSGAGAAGGRNGEGRACALWERDLEQEDSSRFLDMGRGVAPMHEATLRTLQTQLGPDLASSPSFLPSGPRVPSSPVPGFLTSTPPSPRAWRTTLLSTGSRTPGSPTPAASAPPLLSPEPSTASSPSALPVTFRAASETAHRPVAPHPHFYEDVLHTPLTRDDSFLAPSNGHVSRPPEWPPDQDRRPQELPSSSPPASASVIIPPCVSLSPADSPPVTPPTRHAALTSVPVLPQGITGLDGTSSKNASDDSKDVEAGARCVGLVEPDVADPGDGTLLQEFAFIGLLNLVPGNLVPGLGTLVDGDANLLSKLGAARWIGPSEKVSSSLPTGSTGMMMASFSLTTLASNPSTRMVRETPRGAPHPARPPHTPNPQRDGSGQLVLRRGGCDAPAELRHPLVCALSK